MEALSALLVQHSIPHRMKPVWGNEFEIGQLLEIALCFEQGELAPAILFLMAWAALPPAP